MVTLHPFAPEHIQPCAEIMLHNDLWQRHGVTEDKAWARFEAGLQEHEAIMRVATLDGNVAGFIWYYLRGTFYSGGYIRLVGVDKVYQGQGIGQVMMAQAEHDIRQATRQVFLLVSDFNTDAQRFYQNRGYTSIGAIPDFVTPGISEMIYWKRLE